MVENLTKIRKEYENQNSSQWPQNEISLNEIKFYWATKIKLLAIASKFKEF